MKITPRQHLLAAALVGALAHLTTTRVLAQTETNAVETTPPTEAPEPPPYRPWTIGAGVGTDGIFGGGVSWRFSDHLGTRFGVGYSESTWDHVGIADIHYDAKLRLLLEPLTLDVYPWQKHSFHVSVGMMFNQNQLTGSASGTGTITIDGQPFTRSEVGSLNMKVTQQPVNPYLTIGGTLFYFDRAHHVGFAGELGAAYTGNPDVSLTRSGPPSAAIDRAVNGAQGALQHYADQYKWWPIVKVAVTYSF